VDGPQSRLPDGYDIEYLIYNLAGGEAGRKKDVEEMTFVEAMKWAQLAKYDSVMQKAYFEWAAKQKR